MLLKLILVLCVSMIVAGNDDEELALFDACVTESGASKEVALKIKDQHDFSSDDPKVKVLFLKK